MRSIWHGLSSEPKRNYFPGMQIRTSPVTGRKEELVASVIQHGEWIV